MYTRRTVDVICLNFWKAFNIVSHSTPVYKLGHYGLEVQTRCVKKCWDDRAQGVMVSGSYPSKGPVRSGVLSWDLSRICLNVLMSLSLTWWGHWSGASSSLQVSPKCGGPADMLEGKTVVQRDPGSLEKVWLVFQGPSWNSIRRNAKHCPWAGSSTDWEGTGWPPKIPSSLHYLVTLWS